MLPASSIFLIYSAIIWAVHVDSYSVFAERRPSINDAFDPSAIVFALVQHNGARFMWKGALKIFSLFIIIIIIIIIVIIITLDKEANVKNHRRWEWLDEKNKMGTLHDT